MLNRKSEEDHTAGADADRHDGGSTRNHSLAFQPAADERFCAP
jgi:hypothetical protein